MRSAKTVNNNNKLKKILKTYIWQNDINKAVAQVKTIANSSLTPRYKKIKKNFLDNFINNKEIFQPKSKDLFVKDLLNLYQSYWKKVLLGDLTIDNGEKYLSSEIKKLLKEHHIPSKNFRNINSLTEVVSKELDKRKLYHILGVVQPLRELEIWKKETREIFNVELFNRVKQEVCVVFMEDFITNGWASYASQGVAYPGGWAKKDALYCVKKAYNTKSESFKVSYLVHEAQHFCDYKQFPKLKQIDLEYRAKLAEIYSSKRMLYSLIDKFITQAHNDPSIPHSHSNHKLIYRLSNKIFKTQKIPKDINIWKKAGYSTIQTAAQGLYEEHSKKLISIGAKRVTGVL